MALELMAMTHPLLKESADLATAVNILDSWVAQRVKRRHQPGLAIGVVYRGRIALGRPATAAPLSRRARRLRWIRAFALPASPRPSAATGILQLRDAGLLSLDDAVSQYLHWFDLRFQDAPGDHHSQFANAYFRFAA